MPCGEASRREDEAFRQLARAMSSRGRVDASVAVNTKHWEAYETAINELTAALRQYEAAAEALAETRGEHVGLRSRAGR